MSVGYYNPNRAADVNPENLEIFYTFSPNREEASNEVFRLNPTETLETLSLPNDENNDNQENLLEGLYNLKLSASIFNQIGIYCIYIRPKTYNTTIVDCGVLSALPNVKGIVINGNDLPSELRNNNALQGHRIEYYNTEGLKIRNLSRFVVSSNKVIPVTENVGNTSQSSIRYRFDDSGNLLFLQLTPSSASSIKPNTIPFIGVGNQKIKIFDTSINPVMIEVEMVENDINSVMDIVAGETIRDVDNGIVTYYNKNREITHQFDLFEIKEETGSVPSYEVKQRRENIDESQNFDDVVENIQ